MNTRHQHTTNQPWRAHLMTTTTVACAVGAAVVYPGILTTIVCCALGIKTSNALRNWQGPDTREETIKKISLALQALACTVILLTYLSRQG